MEGEAGKHKKSLCINATKRHKLNISRTLKLAACRNLKYIVIRSYIMTVTETKTNSKGPASQVHRVLRNGNFWKYFSDFTVQANCIAFSAPVDIGPTPCSYFKTGAVIRPLGKWVRCRWHSDWANIALCTSSWFDVGPASGDGGPASFRRGI